MLHSMCHLWLLPQLGGSSHLSTGLASLRSSSSPGRESIFIASTPENFSGPNTSLTAVEVKQTWIWSVPGWETSWDPSAGLLEFNHGKRARAQWSTRLDEESPGGRSVIGFSSGQSQGGCLAYPSPGCSKTSKPVQQSLYF